MKKVLLRLVSALLWRVLVFSCGKSVAAYTPGAAYQKDLHTWIQNDSRRSYMEMMLDYHVRNNPEVQRALKGGYSAVFLFDGCSDNMDDPVLSDLSYYRVSGVCVVLRKDENGEIKMVYFNDNASTIPDRPLEYGAWYLPDTGSVGPATILDGTYELYSVYHKGKYEALHVRSDYRDATIPAIYMTPDGFAPYRATEINIHTRTSNHTSGRGMWSAGCPLVGGGASWEYWKLIESTYHQNYDGFEVDNYVGSLTIDRQALRTEMYTLYRDADAVDAILEDSYALQPEKYLATCGHRETYPNGKLLRLTLDSDLMTLPCSNDTDARSLSVETLKRDQTLMVYGSLFNSQGNLWYQVYHGGKLCYLYAGHTEELRPQGFWTFWNRLFGWMDSE